MITFPLIPTFRIWKQYDQEFDANWLNKIGSTGNMRQYLEIAKFLKDKPFFIGDDL